MFHRNAFNTDRLKIHYEGHSAPALSVQFVEPTVVSSNVSVLSDYTTEPTGYLEITHTANVAAVLNTSQGNVTLDPAGDFLGNIEFDYSIGSTDLTANFYTAPGGKLLGTDTQTLPGVSATVTPSIGQYYSNISFAIETNITSYLPTLTWEIVSDSDVSGYFTSATSGNVTLVAGDGTVTVDYDKYHDNANTANVQFHIEFRDPRTNNLVASSANVQIEQAAGDTFFIEEGTASGDNLPWTVTTLSNGDRLHRSPIASAPADILDTKYVISNVTIGYQAEHVDVRSVTVGGGGAGGLGLSMPYIFSSPTQDYLVAPGGGGAGGGVVALTSSAASITANVSGPVGKIGALAGTRGIAQYNADVSNYEILDDFFDPYGSNIYIKHGNQSIFTEAANLTASVSEVFQNRVATALGGKTSFDFDIGGSPGCGAGAGFRLATPYTGTQGGSGGNLTILTNSIGTIIRAGGGGGAAPEDGADALSMSVIGDAADGGDGFLSDITGANVRYGAGGGAGETNTTSTGRTTAPGEGGLDNGGTGGETGTEAGEAGVAFYGSGGGGASAQYIQESGGTIPDPAQADGGEGGDGVVYVRYPYQFRRLRTA